MNDELLDALTRDRVPFGDLYMTGECMPDCIHPEAIVVTICRKDDKGRWRWWAVWIDDKREKRHLTDYLAEIRRQP